METLGVVFFIFSIEKREAFELTKAFFAVSLAFGIIIWMDYQKSFLYSFLVACFCVGVGFIAHELAHKYLAMRYGAKAEFHANDLFLALAVGMSLFGFVFAAPGAVEIRGRINRKQQANISAVGIVANIVIAIVFLTLYLAYHNPFLKYGMLLNGWLALFNILPIPPFDGFSLWQNSKKLFVLLATLALGLQLLGMAFP